ncbi:MAG: exodeoxyribonuclease III [Kiritimatiellia bacterium]|nr:exodeoxyribonuclease III [Kiritimatiellia bacterium]
MRFSIMLSKSNAVMWDDPGIMRIATFNANSIRSRLDIILAWLDDHSPDVLCIQETKVQDCDFPALPFLEKGYEVTYRGQKSYNGVAVISRARPTAVQFGFDDGESPDETRLVYTRFGPVHIVNTYVPQGREINHEMYQYKLNWFRRLRTYFESHFSPRMKVLWLGDLNVAREPMDIHNSEVQAKHVCYHVDVREAFAETQSWGFVDVFRKYHPEPGQFTFFDYRTPNAAKRKMGWRIDHMLATKSLAAKSTDSYIDLDPRLKPKPSDHTFLVADFNL